MSLTQRTAAALLGTAFLVSTAFAQEPFPATLPPLEAPPPSGNASVSSGLPPSNQALADAVARSIKDSGRLQRYRIDIQVNEGVVDLDGRVTDLAQKQEAFRVVQSVPGVLRVRDRLLSDQPGAIVPVQAPEQGPDPKRLDPMPMPPAGAGGLGGAGQGMPPDPLPIQQVPQFDPMLTPPPMPPYAWPTYAPYNNYSRVAYPTLYPYEAFPYIGPFYPFPKVPPSWRSVTLTWNDGFWWYGKNATGHDWWRIRYR